ncbi:hypothetical protein SAMN05216391_13312 [Lachnospiraceae bacterium KHCPX20]|nr:hypothetical protein SAMN05216391_13312 [Lachnospiraceae bacterium KHCPX20]
MIIIQHEDTKENMLVIKNELNKLGHHISDYSEKKGAILSNKMLSSEGRNKQIAELDNEVLFYAKNTSDQIVKNIEAIDRLEKQNAEIYNIDDFRYMNAVQLISTMGKDMEYQERLDIVNTFRGEKKALQNLKAVFNKFGYSVEELDKCLTNISSICERMTDDAIMMQKEAGKTGFLMFRIMADLRKINEVLGVGVAEDILTLDADLDSVNNDFAKTVMGL